MKTKMKMKTKSKKLKMKMLLKTKGLESFRRDEELNGRRMRTNLRTTTNNLLGNAFFSATCREYV